MDISLAEMLVVMVVAVIFIGPKELPTVVRALAKAMRWLRNLSCDVRTWFDNLAEESGVKDAADAVTADIRLIKGDDGNLYESYDLTKLPTDTRHSR